MKMRKRNGGLAEEADPPSALGEDISIHIFTTSALSLMTVICALITYTVV